MRPLAEWHEAQRREERGVVSVEREGPRLRAAATTGHILD